MAKKFVAQVPTAEQIKATEQYLETRRVDAAALVNAFNTKHRTSIVYLKLTGSDSRSFQLHLSIHDRFVNHRYYDEGTAVTYFSDAVYEEIQKLAGNKKVNWNNTASTGWLAYTE